MNVNKLARRWARPARDFVLGLGLYVAIAVSSMTHIGSPLEIFVGSAQARLFEPAADGVLELALADDQDALSDATPVARSSVASPLMLALAFASLFSLNMWFARHLRLAYLGNTRTSGRSKR